MITPNHLTGLRILIAFASPLLLIWHRSIVSELIILFLFTIACITDWWDGYLARKKSMVTRIGKLVDPIADKLLILGLMLTFSRFELYTFEWIVFIFMRELTITIARLVNLKKGKVIPAEWAGKVKVGFQIGSIYATLLFLLAFDSGLFWKPAAVILFVFQSIHYLGIFLATIVTMTSGVIFFHRLSQT